MSNIKSGTSNINFNYNVKGVGSVVNKIIANVSNGTVANTAKVEAIFNNVN